MYFTSDAQSSAATRGDTGEAEDKTKFIISTGPRERRHAGPHGREMARGGSRAPTKGVCPNRLEFL